MWKKKKLNKEWKKEKKILQKVTSGFLRLHKLWQGCNLFSTQKCPDISLIFNHSASPESKFYSLRVDPNEDGDKYFCAWIISPGSTSIFFPLEWTRCIFLKTAIAWLIFRFSDLSLTFQVLYKFTWPKHKIPWLLSALEKQSFSRDGNPVLCFKYGSAIRNNI